MLRAPTKVLTLELVWANILKVPIVLLAISDPSRIY